MTDPVTGADLVELREIADIHLVNVANVFASAIEQIHDADDSVFVVPGINRSGSHTSLSWTNLHFLAEELLRTTYRNLTATSEALHRLIEDYQATDDSLADAMQAEWDRNYDNEDHAVAQPPRPTTPPGEPEYTSGSGTN